jgi:hypothetical protein
MGLRQPVPDLHLGRDPSRPAPTALYYVGDLDAAGLRIALNTAAAANTHHLPPLQPAVALYERLLAHGVPRPGQIQHRHQRARPATCLDTA